MAKLNLLSILTISTLTVACNCNVAKSSGSDLIELHSRPDAKGEIIGQLPKNGHINVIDDEWVKVDDGNVHQGWITQRL